MSPAKILEDIRAALARYAPIIVVHFLLILWLAVWVFPTATLPDNATFWGWIEANVDTTLRALGISTDRWVLIATLATLYVLVFEWLRERVLALPFFQLTYRRRYGQELLAYAAQVLQMAPSYWDVSGRLGELVERYEYESLDERRYNPFAYHSARDRMWRQYYGTVAVLMVAALLWALLGFWLSPEERGRLWETALLLAFAFAGLRWKLRQIYRERNNDTGYWALRQYQREHPPPEEDRLAGKRHKLIDRECAFESAMGRTPAQLVAALAHRLLPERLAGEVTKRIAFPPYRSSREWSIFASYESKAVAAERPPPAALSTEPFAVRFTALLECTGAGLCLLAPREAGLAPSLVNGGASYCFAGRRHDDRVLAVELRGDGQGRAVELAAGGSGVDKAYLAEIGPHPIELAAQRDFPPGYAAWFLLWPPEPERDPKKQPWWDLAEAAGLSARAPFTAGSTYLMRIRRQLGTEAAVAFQCFLVDDSRAVLLAWRILDVVSPEETPALPPPWWQPSAWQGLWRDRPG